MLLLTPRNLKNHPEVYTAEEGPKFLNVEEKTKIVIPDTVFVVPAIGAIREVKTLRKRSSKVSTALQYGFISRLCGFCC